MAIPTGLGDRTSLPQAVFTDFSSLDALRSNSPEAPADGDQLEEAARQFSSIFLHMALKSMREASFGGGILDSQQSEFYRDMFDQQIALDLSEGEGFGMTQLIVDQLTQNRSPVEAQVTPLQVVQTYSQVANSAEVQPSVSSIRDNEVQETPVAADRVNSGQASIALEASQQTPQPDANATSRLALP